METMMFAATMLACLSAAMAFNCPDDAHAFYHADVSTGCQVYHHCENSELQTRTCPSGEAFNHVTLQCEDASTVDCIETMPEHSHHHHQHHHHHKRSVALDFNCPEDAHTFYHADVSSGCQVYHVCENSELQTLTCPPAEAFNHLTLQCEDASTVDCIETMGEHSHHHHQHHHHHKRSVDFAFNCPNDAHTFYHADVSTGCQVYHVCENSELQTFICPSGQAFNHVTLLCEYASTVDCIETIGEHSHHHHQYHHHHKRSVALDFNCPDDVHTFYHADVSTGCQVYHHCQNSELQTLTCPPGEAFNHVTLQCEDASTVDCIETMPEHSHHHHQHHHHHKRSAAADFNCPEDSHTFYHADVSTGCQVYHLCQNSQLQTLSCPSGQAFNHVTLQCEDASTVECVETMGEHSHHHHEHVRHKRSAAVDFNCPDDAHTFYHADVSTGCQVYHLCQNSQLQTFTCASGQAFNHVTLQCEDASTVDCIETMGEHSHHHHQIHHHHKRSAEDIDLEGQKQVKPNKREMPLVIKDINIKSLQKESTFTQIVQLFGDAYYKWCRRYECGPNMTFESFLRDLKDPDFAIGRKLKKIKDSNEEEQVRNKRETSDSDIHREQSDPNKMTIQSVVKESPLKEFLKVFFYVLHLPTNSYIQLCNCGTDLDFGSCLTCLKDSDLGNGQNLEKDEVSKENEQVRNKRETREADIDSFIDTIMYLTEKFVSGLLYGDIDHEQSKPNKMTISSEIEEKYLDHLAHIFNKFFRQLFKCNKSGTDSVSCLRDLAAKQNLKKAKVSKEDEQVRNKRETRDADIDSVVDRIADLTEKYARDSLYGNGTSFLFKIVMPVFYEMMENEQTRMDVLSVVISAKNIFKPVALQILKNQNPADKTINIPRRIYDNSVKEFLKENRIVIEKVIERHLKAFVAAGCKSIPFFVESAERLKAGGYPQADTLKKAAIYFYQKHGKLLQTSSSASMKFYPVKEILEDIIPIKNALRQIFMDYFKLSEDSWLSFIFGDMHSIEKVSSKYSKPIPKLYSKKSTY